MKRSGRIGNRYSSAVGVCSSIESSNSRCLKKSIQSRMRLRSLIVMSSVVSPSRSLTVVSSRSAIFLIVNTLGSTAGPRCFCVERLR